MTRYLVLAALLLLINTITINRSRFFTHMSQIENPQFTLTLQYGSLDSFKVD